MIEHKLPVVQKPTIDIGVLVDMLTEQVQKKLKNNLVSVSSKQKQIMVGGEKFVVDSATLIRMIKQITQTIGEYKGMDNVYSRYIIPCLRKARSDMASDLEKNFNVKWQINKNTGESVFFT